MVVIYRTDAATAALATAAAVTIAATALVVSSASATVPSSLSGGANSHADMASTGSTPLANFDALMSALDSGAQVRYTTRYSLCKGNDVNATGGDSIETYEYFYDKRFGDAHWVAFSKSKLIANYLNPQGVPFVYDFVRVRVYSNSTVQIEAQYINPLNLTVTMDEAFVCQMDDGSPGSTGGWTAFATSPIRGAGGGFDARPSSRDCADEELLRFHTYIVGHFTNEAQVQAERNAGKQVHPFAEHISDVASQKIDGLPEGDDSVWVLEESYYTTGGVTKASPFLFRFSRTAQNHVAISAYDFPPSIPPSSLRNNNTALRFNYADLKPSKSFTPATYEYSEADRSYSVYSATPLPHNTSFVLNETIAQMRLTVMEDVIVNGHSVMPYHTPLLYDRI